MHAVHHIIIILNYYRNLLTFPMSKGLTVLPPPTLLLMLNLLLVESATQQLSWLLLVKLEHATIHLMS